MVVLLSGAMRVGRQVSWACRPALSDAQAATPATVRSNATGPATMLKNPWELTFAM
jgi:hypothetical protein